MPLIRLMVGLMHGFGVILRWTLLVVWAVVRTGMMLLIAIATVLLIVARLERPRLSY